jgi:hypothetical protein
MALIPGQGQAEGWLCRPIEREDRSRWCSRYAGFGTIRGSAQRIVRFNRRQSARACEELSDHLLAGSKQFLRIGWKGVDAFDALKRLVPNVSEMVKITPEGWRRHRHDDSAKRFDPYRDAIGDLVLA